MIDVNNITLSGEVLRLIRTTERSDGTPVLWFEIGVTTNSITAPMTIISIEAVGDLAKKIRSQLFVGDHVFIHGRLRVFLWKETGSHPHNRLGCQAQSIQHLSHSRKHAEATP